jgi:hypothetical protein
MYVYKIMQDIQVNRGIGMNRLEMNVFSGDDGGSD